MSFTKQVSETPFKYFLDAVTCYCANTNLRVTLEELGLKGSHLYSVCKKQLLSFCSYAVTHFDALY